MKFYNWDTDARGHMWSYETPDGAWVSRTAAETLAAQLAGYKESHDKYCPSAARIRELAAELQGVKDELYSIDKAAKELGERNRDLEAALREIARRESEAREIVTQNRWPSTLAIDLASQARLALEPPVSKSQQKRIDALTAPETPEGYSQAYADQMRTALLEIVSHSTASTWECKPLSAIAARGLGAASETKAKELDCRHGIPRSLCSECPTSDRGEKR